MTGEDLSRYRLVNWEHLFSGEPDPETDWLAEPFIERGTSISVYGDVKAGKSLLLQDIGARLATGRPVLASPARAPVHVLYLDWENSEGLLRERYRDKMGYSWQELAPYLHYASYPALPHFDTPEGGQAACWLAWQLQAAFVVVDTTSRVIGGKENSADTFADVYKYTLMPLKRNGVTTARLDHEGKDAERGQRGTSAKGADVDTVWHLVENPKDHLLLHPDYDRARHAEQFRLVRADGPLRHEMVTTELAPAQMAIAAELARLGVPGEASRDACRAALKTAGVQGRTDDLAAAVRWRKSQTLKGQALNPGLNPTGTAGNGLSHGTADGKLGQSGPDLVGQQLGQMGQPTWDNDPTHSVGLSRPGADLDFATAAGQPGVFRAKRKRK